jgi:hypothetical protein
MNNDDDDNPIVCFKKPSNRTNIDLREKLCLHAKEILEFRQLTCCIENEDELQLIVVALMIILHRIKENANERRPTNTTVSRNKILTIPTCTMPTIPTMDSLLATSIPLVPRAVQLPTMDALRETIGLPPFQFPYTTSSESESSIY